jgi:predicted ATPase/signal transduction histidine kinase/ActR/RegA family two-component response regulator
MQTPTPTHKPSAAYDITESLSHGSRWTVYRAIRSSDCCPVVLKVLDAQRSGPNDLERLKNELEVCEILDSAAVIKALALDSHAGMPALVLEDFHGRFLSELVGTPMPIDRFLSLAIAIAKAVAEVHRAGFVHRDLKPDNILVSPAAAEVKLAELGLASRLPREQPAASAPALIEGSFPYLSPEQTGRTNRAIDQRSDLYALGVTFFQMLTGKLPFEAKDPVEWIHCHLARVPPAASQILPQGPEAVAEIVLRLLSKAPEDRYQSAQGLRHDLERCLAEWAGSGTIAPFTPGKHDISGRLQIPQKLYGRDTELALLREAFGRVATEGTTELLLVSGYSGIGKSAFVRELEAPVIRGGGFFISGKFDQYIRDIPYATLVQALRERVLWLIGQSEEQTAPWKQVLTAALGINAQVIVDVIPEVELVIGRQPPAPELPPIEAQNRFRMVFRRFIGVFADKEHPLVLFLDDLQWADSASLGLLQELLPNAEVHNLLIIGAYRDNEVSAAHPLRLTLGSLREKEARISEIVLGPIPRDDFAAFIGDALRCRPEEIEPLADLLCDKTAGNPFFAIQFLTALHAEGLVAFDRRAERFQWDMARIREKGFTDNVVDLMVATMKRLPAATQEGLKQLACLGSAAEAATLTLVLGGSEEKTEGDLWEAACAGLVRRVAGAYEFLHDRVREAAYSLIPEELRAAMHLRIGRLLSSHWSKEAISERVFDVANQWNRGAQLLTDARDKEVLFRLNVHAGTKAKATIAYASARTYLGQAMALLPPAAWSVAYKDTLTVYLELSECTFLGGDFQRADELLDVVLANARSPLDRARAYQLRIWLYPVVGRYRDAVAAMVEAVRPFGITFPNAPEELAKATEAEIAAVSANLAGRSIADIVDAPAVTDPNAKTLIALLVDSLPAAYASWASHFPLLSATAVKLCLRHGNCAAACHAYANYAIGLTSFPEAVPMGFELSRMALRLNEKLGDRAFRGRVLFLHGTFINYWREHLAGDLPLLEQAFSDCLEVGDLAHAGYVAWAIPWHAVEKGDSLPAVLNLSQKYATFARDTRNAPTVAVIRLVRQFVATLKGTTLGPTSFDDGTFDEAATLNALEKAIARPALSLYYTMKQQLAFLHGLPEESLGYWARASETKASATSMLHQTTSCFYHALALAAVYRKAPVREQPALLRTLEQERQKLERWANNCPANFQNRYALVSAELARIEDRDLDAIRLYEGAIRSARENGFVHHEALASELAGRFYLGRNLDTNGLAHLRDARACYVRWGAAAKVKQLDQQYPHLVESRLLASSATVAMRPEQLDLHAVAKASQTISSEIVLDKLLRTLLTIVLEQGGADRACLVLRRGETLCIEAEATVDPQGIVTIDLEPAPLEGSPRIPASVVQYAHRTKERVILNDDTSGGTQLADDDYFVAHRPKSVLCLPILRQGEVVGLLYLENDLLAAAFTPDRLVALELLATQAAISLENALLLAKEKTARANAALLAEAGALLSESFDYQTTFARLGRLCVQELSDGCLVDLVDGRALRRLTMATRDPAREPIVAELQRRYPPRWDTDHPTMVALRTGEPVLTPEVTDEGLRAMCQDEEHLRLARGTKLRSLLTVPLVARGQTLGVLSFGSDTPRRYGPADLELAVELGRRAASAVDNARLYEASQEEVRLRKAVEAQLVHAQKLDSIGRLAGGIAHDFNNLLVVINGYSEMIESNLPADDPHRAMVHEVRRAGDRAAELTRQLLSFSRKQVIAPRVLDLNQVIASVEKMILRLLGEDIQLVNLYAPDLASVSFDPGQVEQIVVNLAVNARDAMPNGGRLTIQTSNIHVDEEYARLHVDGQSGPHVLLQVSDTGVGMPADVRAHLFEPFFTTKEPGKGTGLGLAMVYGAVQQNGGRIEVYSEIGLGTTFKIFLPAAAGLAVPPVARVSVEALARPTSILFVEDDERVRTFATSVLARVGHTIHAFANGEDALAALSGLNPTPELLITDVIMSGMDGRGLAENVAERLPNVRVLFVSGYPDNVIVHHGVLEKGIEFLAKPFSIEQLTRRVNEVLGASA